ncbi:MAG: tRNA pseudouridine(55) synthase TruB [Phaeodactylibacter sp.]|nr:tRNA pseudouridine(55) synthase TruB [Phaeodactylibacter sp.]
MKDKDPLPEPSVKYNFLEGATLLVDKPKGWTSFDVVNKLRYKLKQKLGVKKIKVGHAGTLDPMATGLLIICTGKSTKQIDSYQNLPKEYIGTLTFGATTPSYDAETEVDGTYPIDHLNPRFLREKIEQFKGKIEQVPPMFSAIKVDGQPLYKKARKGEKIEVQARTVSIYDFELTRFEPPEADILVRCSKGTYIRSLAHDLGKAAGSGAYLSALCRTKIGPHQLEHAWQLEPLLEYIEEQY